MDHEKQKGFEHLLGYWKEAGFSFLAFSHILQALVSVT